MRHATVHESRRLKNWVRCRGTTARQGCKPVVASTGSSIPCGTSCRGIHREGAAAETVAHHADEVDQTALEGTRAVPAPLPSVPIARELEAHRAAYTPHRAQCEACERGRGRNADHQRVAAEQDHAVDTASVDHAFFGEHEQTAKPVLILRAHRCRWTEALVVFRVKEVRTCGLQSPVAGMVQRTGLQRLTFKSDQEPSILDLKKYSGC